MATNPTLLLVPIAENGTKNTLPETQATPGNGLMSQSTGFPAECSLPLGAGGVAPGRADFNGAFNLLGGVAFYAQKGWRFTWDAMQDYYEGCIVIDTTDGNAYQAINDVSAGGSVPSLDTTNWILYAKQAATEEMPFIPAFNKRDVITTSRTYTAPVTGWYRITAKGGGGGGMGSYHNGTTNGFGGAGGGEGGMTIGFEHMTAGDTAAVVVGAGGTAGQSGVNSSANYGTAGGDTTVTVNNNTYTGGGGDGGGLTPSGGTGTIIGAPGGGRHQLIGSYGAYGIGAGVGGGAGGGAVNKPGVNGGGGGGASVTSSGSYGTAGAGGDGYVWFEYFASV